MVIKKHQKLILAKMVKSVVNIGFAGIKLKKLSCNILYVSIRGEIVATKLMPEGC